MISQNILLLSLFLSIGFLATLIFFSLAPFKSDQLVSPVSYQSSVEAASTFFLDTAPLNSLRANITLISGNVYYRSRSATSEARLLTKGKLQQGETVKTVDGELTFGFDQVATITLFEGSELNLAQTLPFNLVMVQKEGSIDYQKKGTLPLSIRALHLLIDQKEGEIGVLVSSIQKMVVINCQRGSAKIAFNNLENNTEEITVPKGKKYFFDDGERVGSLKATR